MKRSAVSAADDRYPDATEMMLCWNPGTVEVALIPWPDYSGASRRYRSSTLACWEHVRCLSFRQRKLFVFTEAMHLIMRDSVPAQAVHEVLLGLTEYRDGCSDDMPGVVR